MQAWRTDCTHIVENDDPNSTIRDEFSTTYGHCRDTEMGIEGRGGPKSQSPSGRPMATCVRTDFFIRFDYNPKPENRSRLQTELAGSVASMMISKADGNTPVEVDTFAVEPVAAADQQGASGEGTSAVHRARSRCRDCVELETQQFEKGTEALKAQATLLTTGAAAGILWLALLSG